MVKTFISILVVSLLLIVGSMYENNFIKTKFEDFNWVLTVLYDKIDSESATQDDVYAVQKNWLSKKKVLHIFIPHNEIKEIDLWLSESATLVRDKEWKDAISKIEVLKELAEQIPRTFMITLDNIL